MQAYTAQMKGIIQEPSSRLSAYMGQYEDVGLSPDMSHEPMKSFAKTREALFSKLDKTVAAYWYVFVFRVSFRA